MSEIQHAVLSTASLVKALAIAMIIAIILFVTMVLPVEFGIDPTGMGARLGLAGLAATEPEAAPVARAGEGELPFRQDETTITVPSRGGLEYKFYLAQHASLNYEWSSTGALYFDLHGEPEGDTSGYFESYGAARADGMKGTVTTPFAGSHGWYWRNDTDNDVVVSLKTLGNYDVIGLR